jgi:hypothetical protein
VRKFKAVPETLIGTGQTIPGQGAAPIVVRPDGEFSKLGEDAVKGANAMQDAIERGDTDRNSNTPGKGPNGSQF